MSADPAAARVHVAELPADVPRLWRLADLLADLLDEAELQHAALASGTPLGPVTGLPKLDRELAGRLVPGYHVLHGNTAAGKTSFALQVAATCGAPARAAAASGRWSGISRLAWWSGIPATSRRASPRVSTRCSLTSGVIPRRRTSASHSCTPE